MLNNSQYQMYTSVSQRKTDVISISEYHSNHICTTMPPTPLGDDYYYCHYLYYKLFCTKCQYLNCFLEKINKLLLLLFTTRGLRKQRKKCIDKNFICCYKVKKLVSLMCVWFGHTLTMNYILDSKHKYIQWILKIPHGKNNIGFSSNI